VLSPLRRPREAGSAAWSDELEGCLEGGGEVDGEVVMW